MADNQIKRKYVFNNIFYNGMLIVLLATLFVSAYTFVLQKITNENTLNNAIGENSRRTDAMFDGVQI